MKSTGWANFWKAETHSFNAVMKIATTFFVRKADARFKFKTGDKILDYGCGPGFLADALATKNISITGLDINAFYIEQCKKNHPESLFIHITTDAVENEKIFADQLGKEKFDFIILLSISQYFESALEFEKVIKVLSSYLNDHGKIIIADVIDQKTSPFLDAGALFFKCIQAGKPITFLKFIAYLLFSSYHKISKNTPLLKLSVSSIRQIAISNFMTCEMISGVTIHTSRTNYAFSKP